MAQFVLINPVGTRYAGEVLDTVQDGQDVITQLASFGGVLVPLPNALLEPYIARCEQLRVVGNNDEATAMMQAAYASSTAIAGGGTAGKVPLWTSASGLGDSAITQVAGSILSLTSLVGGAGYASTSTAIVALGSGSGTGATAQIVTSGGAVTWVALKDPGSGYTAGDVLTIPGGSGTITVLAIVPKNDASGHFTAQRIGAGTTQPTAGVDSRYGLQVSGSQVKNVEVFSTLAPVTLNAVNSTEFYSTVPFGNNLYAHMVNVAASATGFAAGGLIQSWGSWTNISASSGANSLSCIGVNAQAGRSYAADQNTNVSLTGGTFSSVLRNANAYTTNIMRGVTGGVSSFSSATGTVSGRAVGGDFFGVFTTPVTVADLRVIDAALTLSGSAAATIAYMLRLQSATFTAPSVAPTTYWGISQEDTRAKSRHYGNFGVGDSLDVGAGKVIASLTLTNGGTGYTSATYSQVALTTVTGTGSGATADIVVAGGIVTTVVLRAPGQGYAVGDTLSCASIGAGSNFLLTVATTASILRSDGTSVAARIGAGTPTPRASLDVVGVAYFGSATPYTSPARGFTPNLVRTNILVNSESEVGGLSKLDNSDTYGTAIYAAPVFDFSALTVGKNAYAGFFQASVATKSSAGTPVTYGTYSQSILNDNVSGGTFGLTGAVSSVSVLGSVAGSNTFTELRAYGALIGILATAAQTITVMHGFRLSNVTINGAAHVVTDYYALRLGTITLGGGATITNRWGIAQEDASANNVLAGRTAAGQAAGSVPTALVDVGASTTAAASLRIRSGTAPTSPNDGDIWFDGTALRIRIGGLTRTVTVT